MYFMEHIVTTNENPLITRPRRSGASAHTLERTFVTCCGAEDSVLWNRSLLRRLATTGETREDFIARTFRHNS